MKVWRTIAVYWISAFGGTLFSSVVSPLYPSVGASTAIFGIAASMISWIIINWTALDGDPYRVITLIWLILIILFNLMMGIVRFI